MFATNANPIAVWKTALLGLIAALLMFAFGYALIPLYYKFCKVFGIDFATSDTYEQIVPPDAREMYVAFDANSHNTVISIRPVQRVATLNTGTAYSITYEIQNLTDTHIKGTAYPSYTPARVANWFTKLQCFCFDEIDLKPRETYRAPVVFILERDTPTDIYEVALSYTFHPATTQNTEHNTH